MAMMLLACACGELHKMKRRGSIHLQDSDVQTVTYLFSYYKQHNGSLPSLQKAGLQLGYTRQAAFFRFQRLIKMGVLVKEKHGEYRLQKPELMHVYFQGLLSTASKELYQKIYLKG